MRASACSIVFYVPWNINSLYEIKNYCFITKSNSWLLFTLELLMVDFPTLMVLTSLSHKVK